MNNYLVRIIEEMEKYEMTQKELSEKTQIPYTTINGWFTKNQRPTIDYYIKMANFFNVSIDYLTNRENDFGNIEIKNEVSEEENELLKLYNLLTIKEKGKVLGYIENIVQERRNKNGL